MDERLILSIPDYVEKLAEDPEAIGKNAARLAEKRAAERCESCGATEDVTLDVDPSLFHVGNDDTERWLCGECRQVRRDNI